nr:MAG TPA: hypothetical protein [Caudoviricetes sp.]
MQQSKKKPELDLEYMDIRMNGVLRLMNVFEPWFDGYTKSNDRVRTKEDSQMQVFWACAPDYAAVLDSIVDQLGEIYNDLRSYNDEMEKEGVA